MIRVRCPRCSAVFDLPPERLGRNVACASCDMPMTARPLAIEDRLLERQRLSESGEGSPLPRLSFAVLVDNVRSLWNVGSIFRTADACGVRQLILCGITGCPPHPQIAKTALGADRCVAWTYRADGRQALARAQSQGYVPVALETSSAAVALDDFEWPQHVCLVIGNEVAGVAPSMLEACPHHVSIPMLGVKESLNVAVAFGIAAYHVARTLAARSRASGRRMLGAR